LAYFLILFPFGVRFRFFPEARRSSPINAPPSHGTGDYRSFALKSSSFLGFRSPLGLLLTPIFHSPPFSLFLMSPPATPHAPPFFPPLLFFNLSTPKTVSRSQIHRFLSPGASFSIYPAKASRLPLLFSSPPFFKKQCFGPAAFPLWMNPHQASSKI